jgi:hypothetical protein
LIAESSVKVRVVQNRWYQGNGWDWAGKSGFARFQRAGKWSAGTLVPKWYTICGLQPAYVRATAVGTPGLGRDTWWAASKVAFRLEGLD